MIEIVGGPRNLGKAGLRRALRGVAEAVALRGGVTVKLADADEARELNRRYRGRDYAPDVLSFPGDPGPRGRAYAGDILICLPVAGEQARSRGHSLRRELFVLAVHGLLHLGGYDHERDGGEMLKLQDDLLRRFGTEIA